MAALFPKGTEPVSDSKRESQAGQWVAHSAKLDEPGRLKVRRGGTPPNDDWIPRVNTGTAQTMAVVRPERPLANTTYPVRNAAECGHQERGA
jgi:hypothetical protein